MVALRIDLALHDDGALLAAFHHLRFLHALQGVLRRILLALRGHQAHHPEGAAAHHRFALQVGDGEIQILQLHPALELVPEVPHDLEELIGVQHQADALVQGLAGGGPALLEQQPSLAEVVPPPQGSEHLVVLADHNRAPLDQVEVPSRVVLLDNNLSGRENLLLELSHGPVDVLLVQVLEEEDIRQHTLDLCTPHDLHKGVSEQLLHVAMEDAM
mmetsp:Transcript_64591/g.154185  ORF Transcript_64591/g.154185 Transcript_64591/m.154185 type:complete len:215 (+) Transcript_64591:431-1075(+)